MGRGIDSRNRVWNWVSKLHRLAGRYDNPMPTWFLAPKSGTKVTDTGSRERDVKAIFNFLLWFHCVTLQIRSVTLTRTRICKPFKEPWNRFPYDNPNYSGGPPGYIVWLNRFLGSLNVYKASFAWSKLQQKTKRGSVHFRLIFFSQIKWPGFLNSKITFSSGL